MSGQPSPLFKNAKTNAPTRLFYTDLKEKDEVQEQESKLGSYVQGLNNKIDYAKWKQDLVLKYNYLPIKRITDKIQNDKAVYLRKIQEEEKNCAKILSGKEITVQLDLFREFSKKLNEKLHQLEVKIAEEKIKNQILLKEVESKKIRLKEKMKENMEVIRSTLEKQGVTNKEDIITLVRSKSTKDRLHPTSRTAFSKMNFTQRKISERKLSSHSRNERFSHKHLLFGQCLSKLVDSIQSMKSSEDIQAGIYLDIMQKNEKKKYSTEGRYSSKSTISNTIHSRFGSQFQQQERNTQNRTDFEMEWETFRKLNWKQIMGILLVKDKDCTRMRNLLRFK